MLEKNIREIIMEPVSRQLQRYRTMTPAELEHRKQVAKIWREKQTPERLKAKQKEWLKRKLESDPDYLRNKRAFIRAEKNSQ